MKHDQNSRVEPTKMNIKASLNMDQVLLQPIPSIIIGTSQYENESRFFFQLHSISSNRTFCSMKLNQDIRQPHFLIFVTTFPQHENVLKHFVTTSHLRHETPKHENEPRYSNTESLHLR